MRDHLTEELISAYIDGELAADERAQVEQALETVRVDTERFNAGRLTTNDLLEAEALLREQRTLFEIARLDVVRAWVRLWLAAGFDDPEELDRWS